MQTSALAIETSMEPKLKFPRLKPGNYAEIFIKEAMKLCPSNLLIARLTGIHVATMSNYRGEFEKQDPAVLKARPFGIVNAYNEYIAPLLSLAHNMDVAVNHKGYYDKTNKGNLSTIKTVSATAQPALKKEKLKVDAPNDLFGTLQAAQRAGVKKVTIDGKTYEF